MARQVVAEFDAITGPFLRKMNQIDASVNRFERNATTGFARVESRMNSLVAASARLSTFSNAIAAGLGTREAARFIDSAKRIRNALREAGDASEETYDRVYESSVRALAGFEDTAQGVLRFQKALNGEQELTKTIRQLETLNKLLALSGKTAQERSSTMIQFSQALQAGFLGGEELRAVRENAPIDLVRAIAREAGGTISDLKDLAKNYELTTEVMIRALDSLEEEADRRFANVAVTLGDASKVFSSGALRFVEGLDNGLGLSESLVTVLKEIGGILGDNAALAENLGVALQALAITAVGGFAGRQGSNFARSIQEASRARLQEAAAAEQAYRVAVQEVAIAERRVRAASKVTDTLILQGASQSKVEKATARQTAAVRKLTKAQGTATAALAATDAAQKRLLLSTRLLTGAVTTLRGVWAFVGGLPGLLLTAGAALVYYASTAESAAQRVERLTTAQVPLEDSIQSIIDVETNLSEIMGDRADRTVEETNRIIAATEEEWRAKMQLLKAEIEIRKARRVDLIDERAALQEQLQSQREDLAQFNNISGGPLVADNALRRGQLEEGIRETLRLIAEADVGLIELEKSLAAAQEQAGKDWETERLEALKELPKDVAKEIDQLVQSQRTQDEVVADNLRRYGELRDVIVETYGEGSREVERFDQAVDRYVEGMINAQNETDGFAGSVDAATSSVIALRDVMDQLARADLGIQDQIAGLNAEIAALESGANRSVAAAANRNSVQLRERTRDLIEAGATPDQLATATQETRKLQNALDSAITRRDELLEARTGGGGGGGGGRSGESQLTKDMEEATRFIESMLTDEERRENTVKNIEALYARLRDRLGENADTVEGLREAIERFGDESIDAVTVLNDGLAQAVATGDSFQEILGRIIARLIEMNGVRAFEALFAGDGFGAFFSTLLGQAANGGKVANGRLTKFATGGIVTSPTYFPLTGGLGLMGEAGAEAIVPLPDGRSIPVKLSVPNLSPEMQVHIHENAVDGAPQVRMTGGNRMDIFLRKAVADTIESGGADRAMAQRYAVKPRPIGG